MKKATFLLALIALVFWATNAIADAPQMINYQGELTDGTGVALDTTVSMEFAIYDDSTGGVVWWAEVHPSVMVTGGMFNIVLGEFMPIDDSVFVNADRWLGITVGGDPEISPRTHFVSVPYAFRVSTVDGSTGGIISGDVSIQSDLSVSGKATIGPGHTNSGENAFVAGENNTASGNGSAVGGGGYNEALGPYSVVCGGGGHIASEGNVASGYNSTIGGGAFHTASSSYSTVGGGAENTASGMRSTVGGGSVNSASGEEATVAGGTINSASGYGAFVGGGVYNSASEWAATVGGGYLDSASGDYSTVGGGGYNTASEYQSTVSGGWGNTASGDASAVGGGNDNTASGYATTVTGGYGNAASGDYSIVCGGRSNEATGQFSFAGGRRAKAIHNGAFVWGSYTNSDFSSQRTEQFRVRADGGARFDINNGRWLQIYDDGVDVITTSMGAHLTVGGVWTNASDRNLKENFCRVDGKEVLDKIARLSITRWNYKSENDDITHMGPVAQDFYSLFGLGGDDKSIASLDEAGVALVAIQALNEKNQELETEVAELKAMVEQLLDQNK